ncbi:MAG: hypothetical protein ABIG61_17755 [Planctomycetota bacterium]
MKKLGTTKQNVIVLLSPEEFSILAGRDHGAIPEGQEIDLKAAILAINWKEQTLPVIKQLAQLADKP